MNTGRNTQSSSSSAAPSAVASARPIRSNRASPLPNTTPDKGVMAASGFLHTSQSYRSALPPQSPFALNVSSTSHFLNREPPRPVNTFFTSSPVPAVRVLIRRLPLNTSEESLRLMVVWSKELVNVELLPVEQSEDRGFRCAILRFRSMIGALEAKKMLDGRSNISNDAEMAVEILATTPVRTSNHNIASANPPNGITSVGPSRPPPQRFSNGAYHPLDRVSPTSNGGGFASHELPNPETGSGSRYQNLFSPQSPIGNHLAERGSRMSGKTLISSDFGDDDETRDILNDPVAYAENGATSQRRATAPQISPVNHMGGLSLTTSNPPGPSSLPPYIHPMSPVNGISPVSTMAPVNAAAPVNAIAPVNSTGPSLGYTGAGAGAGAGAGQPSYGRHSFPPVNPADQNPPCNTLYVGNLPIDTSEEELKAMFSKQRGYKRLCFRTKSNGPMCFVEFEDVSFATKALHELYGQPLHNSVKGGIRLSFSKNPLGVRSGQAPTQPPQGGMPAMNGMMAGLPNGFASASGPPPGLTAPPGLGAGRINYNTNGVNAGVNAGVSHRPNPVSGFAGGQGHPWNAPVYQNGSAGPHNGGVNGNPNNVPRNMMGR